MPGPEAQARVLDDFPQLVEHHHRLDQLDVAELRVPVDVGCCNEHGLVNLKRSEMNYIERLASGCISAICLDQELKGLNPARS